MRRVSLPLLLLLLCLAPMLVAQQPGTTRIHGVITDTSGALLPGVTVQLACNSLGGGVRTSVSDENGEYQLTNVPPGQCSMTFTLAGFSSVTRDGLIAAGPSMDLSVELVVGSLTETVTVTGAAPQVDVSSVSRVVTGPRYRARREPAFNTEAYDRIDDSDWQYVSNRPLSTFSSDVDTASYSNVRRFLNDRQMPPKDAVRVEELINYFSYDYPEPAGRDPFSITASLGECPWNHKHRLAYIGLQARHLDSSSLPPRNLVFLLDVSGSMAAPNKLPLVKASLAMLARNLSERDRIAIVVYAGAAGMVLPTTRGDDSSTVLSALSRLEAGGSTNGADGIALAYKLAREHFIKGGSNRVILATDGDFNVGITNQGDLIRLIEEARETGITLSVLGFGMGNLKDSTMEKLADRGNGNYAYIDSLNEARKVLVEGAAGTLVTVAKDVKLQVEFNPRVVAAYRLIGYENRALDDRDFNDDKKDAGDMGAGHSVTAIYELEMAGPRSSRSKVDALKYQDRAALSAAAGLTEAMTVKARYKEPDGDKSRLMAVAVSPRLADSPEFGFASAVAEFGMLLRDSKFKASSSYAHVLDVANRHRGGDRFGHRAEFLKLVEAASTLD